MTSRRYTPLLAFFILCSVSGCGTYVPQMQELLDTKTPDSTDVAFISAGGALEYKIKKKLYCEIKDAVQQTYEEHLLPEKWGVQYLLNLEVDETSALNPGVAFNTPMHAGITNFKGFPFVSTPQSFSLGLGGILSSQGTRIDKFGSFWDLEKLKQPMASSCEYPDGTPKPPARGSSLLLESNLEIYQWLHDALKAEVLLPSSKSDPASKLDFVSYEIKFIVISTGTIAPTWKLVRIATGNGSLPLASASRTRTHDLTLTFGPVVQKGPSQAALNASLASQIGVAVAQNLKTLQSQ